jgi:hypothetical protein
MRTLTIADRKIEENMVQNIKKGDELKLAAALRNPTSWFLPSISFSPTGFYSPTFRIGCSTVSQNTGSGILINAYNQFYVLGILASKLSKYIFKNFLNHTVHTQEGDLVDFPFPVFAEEVQGRIANLVERIIEKQKTDPKYDYASNEQIEIDKIIFSEYHLSEEDIKEIEISYIRRYPKLAFFYNEIL